MRNSNIALLAPLFIVALWLVSGCGTGRRATQSSGIPAKALSERQFIDTYARLQEVPGIKGKGKVSIQGESGDKNIVLNGIGMQWKSERGKGFELSVRPLSFMEVGRLTVSDDVALLQDKMNQRYYRVTDARRQLGRLLPIAGLDAKMLEAIVENRPFGFVDSGVKSLRRMKFARTSSGYRFTTEMRPGGNRIEHTFDHELHLVASSIILPGRGEISVMYDHFESIGGSGYRDVPMVMQMEVKTDASKTKKGTKNGAKHGLIHVVLQRASISHGESFTTTPPAHYQPVTWEDIIKIIGTL
ncbi:MAG: DUF4292 domain-containing protein [Porphyromonas sp.]|nr:DUF4292 domain-containing protein [Porphyromonas sp.]